MLSVAFPSASRAQLGARLGVGLGRLDAWVDAGAARVEQPFRGEANAGVLGLGVARTGRILSVGAQAAGTLAGDSVGAGQLLLHASLMPPMLRAARTELAQTLTQFGLPSETGGRNSASLIRQSFGWRYGGVFGTLAESSTRRPTPFGDGTRAERFRATSVDVGLWAGYRWLSASLTRQRTLSDDYLVAESTGYGLTRRASSYDFRDMILTTGVALSRLEVQGTFSRRRGGTATRGESHAVGVTANIALTPALSLLVSQGKALADPLRGTPQARMTTASLRWRIGGRRPSPPADAATLETSASGGGLLTVRVRARGTATAEVATSYGEWIPAPMTREEDVYIARIRLPSGNHRVSVRVDGGEWAAPAGLAKVREELGGSAGIVVVP